MGKFFPEILNLCESRKFCDDPASRSANWDQVNKIFSQFQRYQSISKISLKLREYFLKYSKISNGEANLTCQINLGKIVDSKEFFIINRVAIFCYF